MSDQVQFDEDQLGLPKRPYQKGYVAPNGTMPADQPVGGMSGWLVRHGLISSDGGAKAVLGAVVCVNFIAAGLIIYFFVLH